jgi:steroid delta-isomerase-like uncharacterized protein
MMSGISSRRAFIPTAALAFAAPLSACATSDQSGGSHVEELAVAEAWLAAYRTMDVAAFMRLLGDDFYFEDPTFHLRAQNREEMRLILQTGADSFGSVAITPFNRLHASPWVILQQRLSGTLRTQDGAQRLIDVQGVTLLQVRDSRISRWYDYYDVLTFRDQARGGEATGP